MTPFEQFTHQDAKPDFNPVHPRGVFGGEIKDTPMGGVGEESGACLSLAQQDGKGNCPTNGDKDSPHPCALYSRRLLFRHIALPGQGQFTGLSRTTRHITILWDMFKINQKCKICLCTFFLQTGCDVRQKNDI